MGDEYYFSLLSPEPIAHRSGMILIETSQVKLLHEANMLEHGIENDGRPHAIGKQLLDLFTGGLALVLLLVLVSFHLS